MAMIRVLHLQWVCSSSSHSLVILLFNLLQETSSSSFLLLPLFPYFFLFPFSWFDCHPNSFMKKKTKELKARRMDRHEIESKKRRKRGEKKNRENLMIIKENRDEGEQKWWRSSQTSYKNLRRRRRGRRRRRQKKETMMTKEKNREEASSLLYSHILPKIEQRTGIKNKERKQCVQEEYQQNKRKRRWRISPREKWRASNIRKERVRQFITTTGDD